MTFLVLYHICFCPSLLFVFSVYHVYAIIYMFYCISGESLPLFIKSALIFQCIMGDLMVTQLISLLYPSIVSNVSKVNNKSGGSTHQPIFCYLYSDLITVLISHFKCRCLILQYDTSHINTSDNLSHFFSQADQRFPLSYDTLYVSSVTVG